MEEFSLALQNDIMIGANQSSKGSCSTKEGGGTDTEKYIYW